MAFLFFEKCQPISFFQNIVKGLIVWRIENLSDEKTTSDAEPSDLVREGSVSVGASLCIVGTNTTIIIPNLNLNP